MTTTSAENPNYHRSNLIKSFTVANDSFSPYNDFFGSSYQILFANTVKSSTPYVIKQNDRLDLLSYRNYGTTSLWWAIALYNPSIYHPLILAVGSTINIPAKADLDRFFLQFKAGELNSSNATVEV